MSSHGNKRSRADRASASTSTATIPPAVWPREPSTPFPLPSHMRPAAFDREKSTRIPGYLSRATSEEWLPYHSVFYNGLLDVTFDATRVLDKPTLERLKIDKEVISLMHTMGIGNLAFGSHDLYPELARQFLATCEVEYDQTSEDHAAGKLTFMCHGQRYYITLDGLAEVFGMATAARERAFETAALGSMSGFWAAIAFGSLTQADMKISRIRNPVLRIAAKALGHTFFGKKEPGSVRQDELMMLLLGLGDGLIASAPFEHTETIRRIHMGAYFAEVLASRKYKGLGRTKEERIEPMGSLLTPIMRRCGVDLSAELLDTQTPRHFIDDAYLANARICRYKKYQWTAPRGVRYCQLPKEAWATLSDWERIQFELPDTELCRQDGNPVVPPTEPAEDFYAPPPPPSAAGTSTYAAAGQYCVHGSLYPTPEPIVEDFPEEYYAEMEPLPAGAPFDEWRAHSDRVQQRQTGILRRILRGLSRLTWSPSPACCSAPEDVHEPAQAPTPEPAHSPAPSLPAEVSGQEGSRASSRQNSDSSSGSTGRRRRRARLA